MYRRGLLMAGLVALIVALIDGQTALAEGMTPPTSYKMVVPGGKHVFVMIAPGNAADDFWLRNDKEAELRRLYKRSGLYLNDGSTEPVWTVDWYSRWVEAASDGVHLIRHGWWNFSVDQEAISFFANGNLTRTYMMRDLVDFPRLLRYSIDWRNRGQFDDGGLKYSLGTQGGNTFVFDVRTGEIESQSRPALLAYQIAIATFIAAGVFWVMRRISGGKGLTPARGPSTS